MSISRTVCVCVSMFVITACQGSTPTGDSPARLKVGNGNEANVTGSYSANIGAVTPIIGVYDVSAKIHKDGRPDGSFHFRAETSTGVIEISGDVTCLSVDEGLKRAWIGAVITANASTRPDFNQAIHQPGHDVWFRVADRSAGGSGDPDRTTFLGFEGAIPSSAAYCDMRIWPNDAVGIQSGNLTVH